MPPNLPPIPRYVDVVVSTSCLQFFHCLQSFTASSPCFAFPTYLHLPVDCWRLKVLGLKCSVVIIISVFTNDEIVIIVNKYNKCITQLCRIPQLYTAFNSLLTLLLWFFFTDLIVAFSPAGGSCSHLKLSVSHQMAYKVDN